jgi:hypothetical protein
MSFVEVKVVFLSWLIILVLFIKEGAEKEALNKPNTCNGNEEGRGIGDYRDGADNFGCHHIDVYCLGFCPADDFSGERENVFGGVDD